MVVLVPHWSIHNNKGNQQPIKEPHMFDIGLTNLMIYVFLITIQTFYMYLLLAFCNFEVLKSEYFILYVRYFNIFIHQLRSEECFDIVYFLISSLSKLHLFQECLFTK